MNRELRTVTYDSELGIEAYRFQGVMQKFPNHFHEHYVIGFIENGRRRLTCRGHEFILDGGELLLFNPLDVHTCEQVDERALDYRCLNIPWEVMEKVNRKEGLAGRPYFRQPVVWRSRVKSVLREVHMLIMEAESALRKEELFLELLARLVADFSDETPSASVKSKAAIQSVCAYLETHMDVSVTLDELSRLVGWSKYHLLHSFTQEKGISPYSYLVTLRIGKARKLLEQGVPPVEVASRTGFSDQSHLTRFFKKCLGLTPRQYMDIFTAVPHRRTAC